MEIPGHVRFSHGRYVIGDIPVHVVIKRKTVRLVLPTVGITLIITSRLRCKIGDDSSVSALVKFLSQTPVYFRPSSQNPRHVLLSPVDFPSGNPDLAPAIIIN
ncbi:hypothetical protein A2368_03615 [Candidatus Collierbacteria bacterium RIFOXYB1_FULL_49_13]|uniref:Uncharacterized protein n=1 Tax=Candidatus Collierbacteria bacterium RIFOXYB1_FULL_49_13 TaxID=1817728 RepID=A0A1F5FKM3_9BACT|nr:MAG: hypothetical protein A2368_03615 [Candidatus Collierbacteria bacterium RIFOXYB1_FULL_49_13]